MLPVPGTPLTILQTPLARHLANDLYPRGVSAEEPAPLCGDALDAPAKRLQLPRVPPAGVCGECVRIARRWCGWWYFEPWDRVQRQRLLANLEKDLSAATK